MDKFKEKLFGAMVLIALGIIFIPMIFERSADKRTNLPESIPANPKLVASAESLSKPAIIEELIKKQHQLTVAPTVNDERAISAKQPQIQTEFQSHTHTPAPAPIPTAASLPPPAPSLSNAANISLISSAKKEEVASSLQTTLKIKEASIQESEVLKREEASEQQVAVKLNAPAFNQDLQKVNQKAPEQILTSARSTEKINKGWVVQVGTFAVSNHARELVVKLKKAGYPAYIKKIQRQEALLSVVMVGPEIKKSEAIKLKNILDAKYSLQATIIEYKPGK